MPWYVAWAPTPWNGRLGGIYSLPHNYSRWTKAVAFYRRVHRTVRRTPENTVHCPVPCHVSGPLGSVVVDRWIWPLPRLSSAHQTVWCYNLRAPGCGPLYADCLVSHWSIHWTVWCIPDKHCSLFGAPRVRRLTTHFLDFFVVSSGFFCSWVLDFYASFMSSFEVLHPQFLSPILFASCEL
jgi:hypothetical protein